MRSIEAELLQHQYIYVPWVEKKPIYEIAAPLALHLRSKYNARLTVVCPVKSNAPDALAKFPIVTERTGGVSADFRAGGSWQVGVQVVIERAVEPVAI